MTTHDQQHTAEKDAPRFWPFVAFRGTCIAGHAPFRTRFRARMWWHDRRCTCPIPPGSTHPESDCQGYALGSSCSCKTASECPLAPAPDPTTTTTTTKEA